MAEPVIMVEYDPRWGEAFALLRQELAGVLGNVAIAIEHVGSTAVLGLCAKPIIDIDVVVAERQVGEAIRRLAALGCVHQGDLGITGREAFTGLPGRPAHHLYVCRPETPALREHIAFRDYLRAHPDAAAAYGVVKREAAIAFREDR